MRTIVLAVLLAAILAGPALAGPQDFEQVEAGHYQAVLADCESCHTIPGGAPYAGGLPLETPFGKLVPPNITPDRATGIGAWTEEDFRRAVKDGLARGGVRLYPAMPYPAYSYMSDQDVAALWAYMRTIAPVHRAVHANQLPFPFNIRLVMLGWNWLNFSPHSFVPNPAKSAAWNRGAYIVMGPGHCGACHTPKTMLGADKASDALAGASLEGWFAPDIRDGRLGVDAWSADDIVAYLKTGRNAHSIASGPMAEAIENSTSKMTDGDLKAIANYLKDQTTSSDEAQAQALSADDPRMKAGAAIYRTNCSACHGGDGRGEAHMFPPISGNAIVLQTGTDTLVRVVLAGSQAVATPKAPTAPAMPSLAWRLNDQEIADVLTYIRNSWGNAAAPVSAASVRSARAALRSGS